MYIHMLVYTTFLTTLYSAVCLFLPVLVATLKATKIRNEIPVCAHIFGQ